MSALDQPWLHDLVTVLSAPTVVLSEAGGQIRDGRNAQGVLHADVRVLCAAVDPEEIGIRSKTVSGVVMRASSSASGGDG